MASKKKAAGSGTGGKRTRRPAEEVIKEMEARLERARLRQENKELIGSPPVKALKAARTGLRWMTTVDDKDSLLPQELIDEADELLQKLDELAIKYGGRVRDEDAEAA